MDLGCGIAGVTAFSVQAMKDQLRQPLKKALIATLWSQTASMRAIVGFRCSCDARHMTKIKVFSPEEITRYLGVVSLINSDRCPLSLHKPSKTHTCGLCLQAMQASRRTNLMESTLNRKQPAAGSLSWKAAKQTDAYRPTDAYRTSNPYCPQRTCVSK